MTQVISHLINFMASISTLEPMVIVLAYFALTLIIIFTYEYMPVNWRHKCPRCAEHHVKVNVIPGKPCPVCNLPC